MKTKIFTGLAVVCIFLSVRASTNAKNEKADLISSATVKALTKNVEYDFDRAAVKNNFQNNLDQLAKIMIKENYAVSLKGYADSIGTYKYNWVLSDKRANSVKDYLVSKGVDQNRIITTPFGSTQPVATNQTADGRQLNRRVEITLKKIKE